MIENKTGITDEQLEKAKLNILIDTGKGHLFDLYEREIIFSAMDIYTKYILSHSVDAIKILTELVNLKVMKDEFGKSMHYEMRKEQAWEKAKLFLNKLSNKK